MKKVYELIRLENSNYAGRKIFSSKKKVIEYLDELVLKYCTTAKTDIRVELYRWGVTVQTKNKYMWTVNEIEIDPDINVSTNVIHETIDLF